MTRLVVLDNEAVQALASPHHPKHRKVLSHMEAVERRKRLNRLRIMDVPLHAAHANAAAEIHEEARASVADAHIGAIVQLAPTADITVLTSDPTDIRRVGRNRPVTVVAI